MSAKTLSQNIFKINRPKLRVADKQVEDYRQLRAYQRDCYLQLRDYYLRIINTPMGSGKTFKIKPLAIYDTVKFGMKAIISIPRRDIAAGFVNNNNIIVPGMGKQEMHISRAYNLIHHNQDMARRKMVLRVVDFLRADRGGQILLCTHQTLVKVYQHLKRTKQFDLLKKVSLFIDEAHHSQDHSEEDELTNQLGKVVRHFINNDLTLTLITATLFRGDRLDVVSQEDMEKFQQYVLPYDQYFNYLQHLEEIEFSISLFDKSPVDAIKSHHKLHGIGKEIVYVPHTSSSLYKQFGYSSVKPGSEMVDEIFNLYSESTWYQDGSHNFYETTVNGNKFIAIDLVQELGRNNVIDWLRTPDLLKNKDTHPDLITAMNMAKEGSDYPYADTVHIIGQRYSLTDLIQIIGRVLRDVEGKKKVRINYILPQLHVKDSFVDDANTFLNAIVMSMMMERVLQPPTMIKGKKGKKTTLVDAVGGFTSDQNICDVLLKEVSKAEKGTKVSDVVQKTLERFGITNPEIIKAYTKMLCCETLKGPKSISQGIDCGDLDIRLLGEGEVVDGIQMYISQSIGKDVFKEFRDYLRQGEDWALQKTQECIDYYKKHGKYHSTCVSSGLGKWLSAVRQRKNGRPSTCAWYPSMQKLAESQGCGDLFDSPSNKSEAIALQKTQECIDYYKKHGKYPPFKEKNGGWLFQMRRAKSPDKEMDRTWHPSCQELAESQGCGDMFNCPRTSDNIKELSLERAQQCINYYRKHEKYPTYNVPLIGPWLAEMRKAYANKYYARSKLYPVVIDLLKKHNLLDMLTSPKENLELKALERTRQCIEYHNKHGRYPPYSQSGLGKWYYNAKNTMKYDSCIALAKTKHHSDMFEVKK